jgi:diguanylate cyclase (GGDEF)-like protein
VIDNAQGTGAVRRWGEVPLVATSLVSRRTARWTVRLVGVSLVGAVVTSAAGSYLARTVTALAAAAVLLVAARRVDGMGTGRRLIAASLLVGALSGLVSAAYLVVTGHPAPTGAAPDWVYLCYAPLAVAGAVLLPRTPGRRNGVVRALADGAVAAAALWYLVSALVVEPHDLGADLPWAAKSVTLAYPLVPAFVLAVLLSALPRVAVPARPFLVRAAVGLGLLGVSDMAFAVAASGSGYDPTSWIAALNQLGLLAVLDAAMVTTAGPTAVGSTDTDSLTDSDTDSDADTDRDAAARPSSRWFLVPYAPMVLVLAAVAVDVVRGESVPASRLPAVVLAGVGLLVRHLAESLETGRLLERLAVRERNARLLATTDSLTGLPNRLAFLEDLDAALRDAAAHPVAVALLDLNDFKDINDTHGHDTGDEVLRHTATRLRAALPPGGSVARLGGDEFAAFAPASPDGGSSLGATVAEAFGAAMIVGTRPFLVWPSVGVVVDERPVGGARFGDAAHLLAHADVAMYEAKRTKSVQTVPVAVLTGRARASAAATIRIREEVSTPDLTQFSVAYQPVVDLVTGEVRAVEALLRWQHPSYGDVSPATFIPLAERVGSVTVLGDLVFRTALDDLARWTAVSGTDITVGVNVSPRQLTDPYLPDALSALLVERGIAPRRLGVEVTEEALVDDIDAVAGTVTALREAGINVAVDDFGTGYSSLRYLRRFDANIVKIDQEFVQAAPDEARTEALVGSVVTMARALDLICVAEGIETLEQLALVRAAGCHYGQGYLLAKPMPAEQIERLVVTRHVYPVGLSTPAQSPQRSSERASNVVRIARSGS